MGAGEVKVRGARGSPHFDTPPPQTLDRRSPGEVSGETPSPSCVALHSTDLSSCPSHAKALLAQHPGGTLISPNLIAQVRASPGPPVAVIRTNSETSAPWCPAVPNEGKVCIFLLRGSCTFPSVKTLTKPKSKERPIYSYLHKKHKSEITLKL